MKIKKIAALFMATTMAASAFACNCFVSATVPAYDSEAHKELLNYSAEDLSNTSADVKEYGYLYDENANVFTESKITANGAKGKVTVVDDGEMISDPTVSKGLVTDKTTGWTNGGKVTTADRDDDYELNVEQWCEPGNGAITSVNLKAGKTYVFSFWYNSGTEGSGVKVGDLLNETLTGITAWTWTKFTYEVTATVTGPVDIAFYNNRGGTVARFDDISLKDKNPDTYGEELIADPSADKGIVTDGTTGWKNGYNASINKDGDSSFIVVQSWTGAGNGALTTVNLKAGKKYILTFRHYCGFNGAGVKIGSDLNETLTVTSWVWGEHTYEFTASTTGAVNVNFYNNQGSGVAWFDDVSLKEINPDTYGEELIADPSADKGIVTDGTTGWKNGYNASINKDGDSSFIVVQSWTGAGNGALTTVNLEAGKKYILTFRHYCGFNGAGVKIGSDLNETLTVTSWVWGEYTYEFTASTTGTVNVNFYNNQGSGVAWFDDVSLKEINPVIGVDAEVPGAVTALLAETANDGQYVAIEMSYDNGYWIGLMSSDGTKGTAIVSEKEYPANDNLYLENKTELVVKTAGGKLTVYMDGTEILTDYEGVTIPALGFFAAEDVTYSVNASVYTDKDNYDYLGDLNGDMTINVIDLVRAKKISVGSAEAYNTHVAAFNETGTITSVELILLRKYLMGSITSFVTESVDSVSVDNFF